MKTYIGVDLGGTNLRIGLFDENLKMLEIVKFETEVELGSNQIIDKIIVGINQLKSDSTVGVSICVPGQVDPVNSVIKMLTNLDFHNVEIGKIIKERCNLDTVLNNDANLAGLGESTVGIAKNDDLVYFITWSTGIGGALIVNKELINGKNMCSGEIGNLVIHSTNTYKHSFMNAGALEGLASGTALKRYAVEQGYENAKGLIDAYINKEKKAIETIEFVVDVMARAIAMIAQVVEVDTFVLGGGVTLKSGNILLPLVTAKINDYVMPMMQDTVVIKVAELEDEAGIVGAAYLAKSTFK